MFPVDTVYLGIFSGTTLINISLLHIFVHVFVQNPVGRIVNRFSKDQSLVDEILPSTVQVILDVVFKICALEMHFKVIANFVNFAIFRWPRMQVPFLKNSGHAP